MAVDVNKEIRRAVDSGKVFFGANQSEKSLNTGEVKLLIATTNAPKELKENILEKARIANTPVLDFKGNSLELGQVCGKPFNILFLTIESPGKSSILKVLKGKKH